MTLGGRNGRGEALTVSILPTLLVTAMGRGSVSRIQTSDFKAVGDIILKVGLSNPSFTGSEFAQHFVLPKSESIEIDLDAFTIVSSGQRLVTKGTD